MLSRFDQWEGRQFVIVAGDGGSITEGARAAGCSRRAGAGAPGPPPPPPRLALRRRSRYFFVFFIGFFTRAAAERQAVAAEAATGDTYKLLKFFHKLIPNAGIWTRGGRRAAAAGRRPARAMRTSRCKIKTYEVARELH